MQPLREEIDRIDAASKPLPIPEENIPATPKPDPTSPFREDDKEERVDGLDAKDPLGPL
jgi:hypothetical protein